MPILVILIGVVKESLPRMSVKRSDIVRAVVVRTKKSVRRKNGMLIRFDDNAAVIINSENNPRGTRIFGPIAREIRDKSFYKSCFACPRSFVVKFINIYLLKKYMCQWNQN